MVCVVVCLFKPRSVVCLSSAVYCVCFVVLCVVCLNVFVRLLVVYCVILYGVLFVMCCECRVVGVCVVCV